jgi:hypothetical protein
MSSRLDCWLNIVDNGNFDGNGSSFTKHRLKKWVKNFVKRMVFTMSLLNNKSTSEVFLVPFLYVNVEWEVWEPTSLTMLKLMTQLWTPSTTRELIDCLSKVLDGTFVACGSRIGRGPDVMFRVSFNTAIMFLANRTSNIGN